MHEAATYTTHPADRLVPFLYIGGNPSNDFCRSRNAQIL
jgi:hypothetical protein